MSERRLLLLVIVAGAAFRLALAATLGLSVDESYEVVVSRAPSLSYLDHPPLSFWIAGLVARVAGSEHRVLLRLPFILIFAASTWLMFRLTARLFGVRAGVIASLLMNVTLVFGVSTGGWILPDGPLVCAMLASALALSRVLLDPTPDGARVQWRWWLVAGATAGVAFLSKYHAIFLVSGALLFVVSRPDARHWLRRAEPYAATAVALVLFAPVLVWNARHGFASFHFQGQRAAQLSGIHPLVLLASVGGQAGYLLPWIWLPLVRQLVSAVRGGPHHAARWLLACLALWPIALFTLVALGGGPGLPHWPAPGYLFLFPLLGDALAAPEWRVARRTLVAAVAAFVALVAIAASDVVTGWMARAAPFLFRRGDPSLDAVDFTELRGQLAARGVLQSEGSVVAAIHWIDAAKIGYALGPAIPILCLCDDPRHFRFLAPPTRFLGRNMSILARREPGRAPRDVVGQFKTYFRSITPAGVVAVHRAQRVALEFDVFDARNMTRPFPQAKN